MALLRNPVTMKSMMKVMHKHLSLVQDDGRDAPLHVSPAFDLIHTAKDQADVLVSF
jgi:hypothetical protein